MCSPWVPSNSETVTKYMVHHLPHRQLFTLFLTSSAKYISFLLQFKNNHPASRRQARPSWKSPRPAFQVMSLVTSPSLVRLDRGGLPSETLASGSLERGGSGGGGE